jgi:hypothetical protein
LEKGVVSSLEYFWSYTFVQVAVYIIAGGAVGILMFLGISAGIVSRRTRKRGNRGAFTVERLNKLAAERLESHMSVEKEVTVT